MQACSPEEFRRRWPGSLRPIAFPEAGIGPRLPSDCHHLLAEFGLPREVRLEYDYITRLTCTGTVAPLATIWGQSARGGVMIGDMPTDWKRYWHLGDETYLQGCGWLCIDELSGALVMIDLDQTEPIYRINSSVSNFLTTLALFLTWSELGQGSRAETTRLRDELLSQSCIPREELEPFWLNIVEMILDGDPLPFRVTLGPTDPEP